MLSNTGKILLTYIKITNLLENRDLHVTSLFILFLREFEDENNTVSIELLISDMTSKKCTCYDRILTAITTDVNLLNGLYDFTLLL